jgi:Resolvase, N terminal domain
MAKKRIERTRWVSYIRVSTVEQAEKELSLAAQRHSAEEFAARHDAVIDHHYVEPGASGTDTHRAGGGDGLVGLDDSDFIGSEPGKTGLHALDQVQEVSLLLVPGRATPAVHNATGRA